MKLCEAWIYLHAQIVTGLDACNALSAPDYLGVGVVNIPATPHSEASKKVQTPLQKFQHMSSNECGTWGKDLIAVQWGTTLSAYAIILTQTAYDTVALRYSTDTSVSHSVQASQ